MYGHSEQGGMNNELYADNTSENDLNARDSTIGLEKSP